MTNSAAAKEYAKALFMLAGRTDRIEAVAADFRAFLDLLDEDRRLKLFLLAPQISAEKKREVFRAALEGKVGGEFLKFLLVTVSKRRQDILGEIHEAFHEELNRHYDRVEVSTVSAVELTDNERKRLTDRLAGHLGKNVSLITAIDPRLLGGLICRIGDVVYDGSLRRRINRLHHQMLKAQ